MGPSRLYRRLNPFMVIVGVLFCVFTMVLFLSPSNANAAFKLRAVGAASNPHLHPTSPFRKLEKRPYEKRLPPPIVHYQMNNVTPSSDPIGNREMILILTPLGRFYQGYWDNLMRLSYPHELITLGFILPKSREGNIAMVALQEQIRKTQKSGPVKDRFASIIIERQIFESSLVLQSDLERQNMEIQKVRRSAVSKARNSLLFTTLGPAISWVLWLDADVIETPTTLIQDLAAHDKPIVKPNSLQRYRDPKTKKIHERPYDLCSWQDSQTAQKLAEKMGPDEVLFEGYADMVTKRPLMADMAMDNGDPNLEVGLDGVGGTILLVKAEVHRDGAMFPPFSFYHLIESEGFAKMAKRLGWKATGLPNYKVYHYNE